jgi:hypothetical protein
MMNAETEEGVHEVVFAGYHVEMAHHPFYLFAFRDYTVPKMGHFFWTLFHIHPFKSLWIRGPSKILAPILIRPSVRLWHVHASAIYQLAQKQSSLMHGNMALSAGN